jgi:spore maturation protein CgeB
MSTEISYWEKQERYQSLVREAWEQYQKGSYKKMAKLLNSSLIYTPYLKAETVVDWVTKFTQLSTDKNVLFDADLLSDLEPWNQALSSSLNKDLATVVKPVDTYYIFDNKENTKKLTDKPVWITLPVSEASHYNIEGSIFSEEDSPKKALMQVKLLETNLKPTPGNVQGLSSSGEMGSYIYLNPNPDVNLFKLEIYIPDSVSYLKLGFRTWHNSKPIFIDSKIQVTQVKNTAWIPRFEYPQPKPIYNLVIATLLDRFSEDCWKYEANIIPLDRSSWQQQFEDNKPAFFFAESIWQGNDGKWVGSMTKYAEKKSNTLRDIINYCKAQKIPTVFWNKEDPPNFDIFIDVAKEFDYIFTTDENCVKAYQEICGHNRVYSLPFAAQPCIHNPGGRKILLNKVCFAGSWFNHKHHERKELTSILLDPALEKGVDIFDRYFDLSLKDERYRFPDKYRDAILGSLSYDKMLSAYRTYKGILNVNTVTDSPTMFSRRVFEALACGTPVISTKSVGMEKMLGKIVKVARNKPETSEFIEKLLSDEEDRQRLAHLGYRCVHQNHTYKHRLDSVLDKLEIVREGKDALPLVSVISVTHRPKDLDNCLQNYQRQIYGNKELLLLLNGDAYKVEKVKEKVQKLPNIRILECRDKYLGECLNYGIENSQGDYLVKCDADDLYGNNFIGDMILPFTFTNSAIVGKWSYYVFLEGSNQLLLRFPGHEHKFTSLVSGGTIMLKREVYDKVRFSAKNVSEDTTFLRECAQKGLRVWSTDKYNFVQMRRKELNTHTWKINEDEVLKKPHHLVSKGLNLEYVYV